MCDEDRSAVSTPCDFSKECVARFTRRSFNRHLLLLPERVDVCRTKFEFNAAVRCRASASLAGPGVTQAQRLPYKFTVVMSDQPVHKPRIRIARSSTQSMIQMANDQAFVTQADQPVQQRDGIPPAGHTYQIARRRGKASQQFCFYLNPIHELAASNFQNRS